MILGLEGELQGLLRLYRGESWAAGGLAAVCPPVPGLITFSHLLTLVWLQAWLLLRGSCEIVAMSMKQEAVQGGGPLGQGQGWDVNAWGLRKQVDGSCCSRVPWGLPMWEMGRTASGRARDQEGQA